MDNSFVNGNSRIKPKINIGTKFITKIISEGGEQDLVVKAPNGKFTFLNPIPGIEPGDVVEVILKLDKGTFCRGEITNLIEKSPENLSKPAPITENIMKNSQTDKKKINAKKTKESKEPSKELSQEPQLDDEEQNELETIEHALTESHLARKIISFILNSNNFVKFSDIKQIYLGDPTGTTMLDSLESERIFDTLQRGKELYYCFRGELKLSPTISFVENKELRHRLSQFIHISESKRLENIAHQDAVERSTEPNSKPES